MTEPVNPTGRYDRDLAPTPESNLSVDEVRVLWSFVHGDIMDGQIRKRLIDDWGFCSRHAWAYAVIEIELWESGAGARGGHQPFDLSILYTALLEEMVTGLGHKHRRSRARFLSGAGRCLVCEEVRPGTPTGIVVTHAGFHPERLAEEANRLTFTQAWFGETESVWADTVCPKCRQSAQCAGTAAELCRRHLLESDDQDDSAIVTTSERLSVIGDRLRALTESMTENGAPATPAVLASWVEAVGWFHGWAFPLLLTSPDS